MSSKGLIPAMAISLHKIQTFGGHSVCTELNNHVIFSFYSKPFSKRFFYETNLKKLKCFNKMLSKHIVCLTVRNHLFSEFWLVDTDFLLIFCWVASPLCCNLPRKCTPVKYKKTQKAGCTIVTQTCSKLLSFTIDFLLLLQGSN